jgi:UDP-N-acetylmuramate dehydrogenase
MEFLENILLAPYTTFKIGGPARWFAEAKSEIDVVEAVEFARERGLALFVLGGGSNLLVSDAGFDGLVLRIGLQGRKEFFEGDQLIVRVEAGEDWNEFVSHATALDCAGIECLAGIPGTVGGTPVQNVGAYGQEVAETIRAVRALDLEAKEFVELTSVDCEFAYRRSLFNTSAKGRYIVTRVDYALTPGGPPRIEYADLKKHFGSWDRIPSLAEVGSAVREIRRSKGMFLVKGDPDSKSAGSFFKNPVVSRGRLRSIEESLPKGTRIPQYPAGDGHVKLAAAWLVEQAGFVKGYGNGPVGISSRHTLALVNRGVATAEDVLDLSHEIVLRIEEKFGIRLEREPVLVE